MKGRRDEGGKNREGCRANRRKKKTEKDEGESAGKEVEAVMIAREGRKK